jgi:hypothetical protein
VDYCLFFMCVSCQLRDMEDKGSLWYMVWEWDKILGQRLSWVLFGKEI